MVQVVQELGIWSLVRVVKVGRVLRIWAGKGVVKLTLLRFAGLDARILLILVHQTLIRVTIIQLVQGLGQVALHLA